MVSELSKSILWRFECVYAAGAMRDFFSIPAAVKTLSFDGQEGSLTKILGRQHQAETFEALLAHAPELITYVSRNHVQFEPVMHSCADSGDTLRVTNLSQNVIL